MVDRFITRPAASRQSFMFPEWLAILSVVAVTAVVSLSHYARNVHEARQAVLREDCKVVRDAASYYRQDTGRVPKSLDDLVQAGYLHTIPSGFDKESCAW